MDTRGTEGCPAVNAHCLELEGFTSRHDFLGEDCSSRHGLVSLWDLWISDRDLFNGDSQERVSGGGAFSRPGRYTGSVFHSLCIT